MRSSIRNPMIVAQFHGDNDESKIKEITFILSHWAVTGGFESRASRMLGACSVSYTHLTLPTKA